MAFATDTYFILLLLLFIAMFSVCVFQFIKIRNLKKKCELYKLVNSASIGGYYLWQKNRNITHISTNLITMLSLRKGNDNFKAITNSLTEGKEEFLEKFSDLKNGKIENFRFTGTATIQDCDKELQCIGCSILDKNYNVTGVIIWFFDVSEYVQHIRSLTSKNTQLDKEIKEYSSIFNTIPIPIWKRDSNFKIKFCNYVYSKFVEGDDANVSPCEIPELDQSLSYLSAIAKDNNRLLRMKKHLVVQGERRFYNITEMVIKNSDEILGFAYDINDQDEIEKELARHISAHADLLESTSSAMAVYGPDTKLRFYNNSFVTLWGLKVKWLDTNPTYGEVLEVLRESRKLPEQVDFKQFRKEQMMLFQDITKPHEDLMHLPDGKSIRIITIPHALGGLLFAYEDVTDRLAMERSFNTLIAVQRETLDNLSEGVALFGEDGRIRLYNPVYIKMWGEEEEYLEGRPHISEVMDRTRTLYKYSSDWKTFKDRFISDILGRKYSVRQERLKNGRIIDILSRPLPNGDTLVSFVDITDSIMAEQALIERNEALEEADNLKTEFLANISYELRTPLTSIIGFSEALIAEIFGKLNNQQMDYVHGINISSSELLALINDILDLASIDAGYMTLDLKEFDIYKVLSAMVKLLQERCQANSLTLTLLCDKNIGTIIADEVRIKHVIFKIISNSIKFTKPGGNITIGAEPDKEQIKIWVEDTGIGIKKEERGKVFERFYKTTSQQEIHKPGVGLGLSIVKSIIQLHSGRVSISSQANKGTKVTMFLKRYGPGAKRKTKKISSD